MKTGTLLSLTIATAGLLALAAPAHAQRHGQGGGGNPGQNMNRGGMQPGMNHGGNQPGMNRGGTQPGIDRGGNGNNGNFHGGNRFNRGRFGGSRVNFFFGGFGYPYYGYGYGYPYYGYGYGYGYGYPYAYGYGYPYAPYYGYSAASYAPQVYDGRVVPRDRRNRVQSDGKDQASVGAQVQQQLSRAGYYHGAIDGVVGDGTRRAIRSYERANGLRVDGEIDDQLLSTMGIG